MNKDTDMIIKSRIENRIEGRMEGRMETEQKRAGEI